MLDLSHGYRLEEFEVHMSKVDIAVIRIFESVLVRVQNEKRRDVEKTYILGKTSLVMSTVGRNRDSEGHSDEISEGNEEHVTKQWRKSDPCGKIAKDFVDMCL